MEKFLRDAANATGISLRRKNHYQLPQLEDFFAELAARVATQDGAVSVRTLATHVELAEIVYSRNRERDWPGFSRAGRRVEQMMPSIKQVIGSYDTGTHLTTLPPLCEEVYGLPIAAYDVKQATAALRERFPGIASDTKTNTPLVVSDHKPKVMEKITKITHLREITRRKGNPTYTLVLTEPL